MERKRKRQYKYWNFFAKKSQTISTTQPTFIHRQTSNSYSIWLISRQKLSLCLLSVWLQLSTQGQPQAQLIRLIGFPSYHFCQENITQLIMPIVTIFEQFLCQDDTSIASVSILSSSCIIRKLNDKNKFELNLCSDHSLSVRWLSIELWQTIFTLNYIDIECISCSIYSYSIWSFIRTATTNDRLQWNS